MHYAPVIIPTLNRKKHLERAIDSLLGNIEVEKTALYISVDYPPSSKYMIGYEQVKDYLATEDLSKFKEVHIYYQQKNLGPSENIRFLKQQIRNDGYNAYILSEDDNEFSPIFIKYINTLLFQYEDDERVLRICGAKDTDFFGCGEYIFFKVSPAYGYGAWLKKDEINKEYGNKLLLNPALIDKRKLIEFSFKCTLLFKYFAKDCLLKDNSKIKKNSNELIWTDNVWGIYMLLTDKVCIIPQVAKARTWGNDGSGVTMPKLVNQEAYMMPLDQRTKIELGEKRNIVIDERNYEKEANYLKRVSKRGDFAKGWLYYLLYLIKNIVRS